MPTYPGIDSLGNLFAGLAASTVRTTLGIATDDDVTFAGIAIDEGSFTVTGASNGDEQSVLIANRSTGGSRINTLGSLSQGMIIDLDYNDVAAFESFRIRFNSDDATTPFYVNRYGQVNCGTVNNSNLCNLLVGGDVRLVDGLTDCDLYVYRTETDESNFERLNLGWSGEAAYLETQGAGIGSQRPLYIEADTIRVRPKSGDLLLYGQDVLTLTLQDTATFYRTARPEPDGTIKLGLDIKRWSDVYAVQYRSNGTDPPSFPEGINATLPTSDPAVAGQLWNDSGTVKISAG
jgi:hypothetical protein